MNELRRFDPVGWFVAACFSVLAGAVALVVAVHLVQAVWVWLVCLVGSALLLAFVVALFVAWQRRRPW